MKKETGRRKEGRVQGEKKRGRSNDGREGLLGTGMDGKKDGWNGGK